VKREFRHLLAPCLDLGGRLASIARVRLKAANSLPISTAKLSPALSGRLDDGPLEIGQIETTTLSETAPNENLNESKSMRSETPLMSARPKQKNQHQPLRSNLRYRILYLNEFGLAY